MFPRCDVVLASNTTKLKEKFNVKSFGQYHKVDQTPGRAGSVYCGRCALPERVLQNRAVHFEQGVALISLASPPFIEFVASIELVWVKC